MFDFDNILWPHALQINPTVEANEPGRTPVQAYGRPDRERPAGSLPNLQLCVRAAAHGHTHKDRRAARWPHKAVPSLNLGGQRNAFSDDLNVTCGLGRQIGHDKRAVAAGAPDRPVLHAYLDAGLPRLNQRQSPAALAGQARAAAEPDNGT